MKINVERDEWWEYFYTDEPNRYTIEIEVTEAEAKFIKAATKKFDKARDIIDKALDRRSK